MNKPHTNRGSQGESLIDGRPRSWQDRITIIASRHRDHIRVVLLAIGYSMLVEWVAAVASRQLGIVQPHEWLVNAVETQPPLMRWDSFWYERIATEGYHQRPVLGAQTNVGFLPLYAWLGRALSFATGMTYAIASLWVARTFFLGSLLLFFRYVRGMGQDPWRATALLICYPGAFFLVSSYSESLYLFCGIAAFVLARRRLWVFSLLASSAAGMTRISALVLVPALVVLAIQEWRAGRRSLQAFLPSAGPVIAHLGLGLYFHHRFGDFFAYFHAKEAWGASVTWPWVALQSAVHVLATPGADVQALLEVGCVALLAGSTIWLVKRRWISEALVVGGTLMMSLGAGILLSLVRYGVGAFPLFLALERATRRAEVWYPTLFFMVCMQVVLLIRFAAFVGLPP